MQIKAWDILCASTQYILQNKKTMLVFVLVAMLIAILSNGVGGMASWGFWPVFASFYVLESIFFRFFFEKVPYFSSKPLLVSLVPSMKVIFIVVSLAWLLSLLPFVPLLLGLPYFEDYTTSLTYADGYLDFLRKYMQDIPLVDCGISLILLLIVPFVIFRPFFAWIAAVMGRRGSLRLAWKKTRDNYLLFLILGLVIFVPLIVLYYIGMSINHLKLVCDILMIPMVLFFNVIMAHLYRIFYEETL